MKKIFSLISIILLVLFLFGCEGEDDSGPRESETVDEVTSEFSGWTIKGDLLWDNWEGTCDMHVLLKNSRWEDDYPDGRHLTTITLTPEMSSFEEFDISPYLCAGANYLVFDLNTTTMAVAQNAIPAGGNRDVVQVVLYCQGRSLHTANQAIGLGINPELTPHPLTYPGTLEFHVSYVR